jgi:hypothetical protein
MAGESAMGWFSGSMALLADGWYMATHAVALGINKLDVRGQFQKQKLSPANADFRFIAQSRLAAVRLDCPLGAVGSIGQRNTLIF